MKHAVILCFIKLMSLCAEMYYCFFSLTYLPAVVVICLLMKKLLMLLQMCKFLGVNALIFWLYVFMHVCSIARTGSREVQLDLKAMVHCHSHGHMITGSSVSSNRYRAPTHSCSDWWKGNHGENVAFEQQTPGWKNKIWNITSHEIMTLMMQERFVV